MMTNVEYLCEFCMIQWGNKKGALQPLFLLKQNAFIA